MGIKGCCFGEETNDGVRYFTVRWADSLLPEEQVTLASPAPVKSYLKKKEKNFLVPSIFFSTIN
jgi:hypothetical protein